MSKIRLFVCMVAVPTGAQEVYKNPPQRSAPVSYGLIEKIVIHEATTEDGVREQNIDIYYRLIGKIE